MALLDLTGDIVVALASNKAITDWVVKGTNGVPSISANRTPEGRFPAITIWEISNRDGNFADDDVWTTEMVYQITMFSTNGNHVIVQDEVDETMRSLGFTRDNATGNYDQNTKIYQRVLHYSIEKDV